MDGRLASLLCIVSGLVDGDGELSAMCVILSSSTLSRFVFVLLLLSRFFFLSISLLLSSYASTSVGFTSRITHIKITLIIVAPSVRAGSSRVRSGFGCRGAGRSRA